MTKIEIIFNGERLYGLSEVLAYLDKQRECISELERENAELKQLIEWLDMAIDSDIPIADKLAELEKENARLKEEIKNNEDLATVAYMQGADRQKKKAEKQLTKAKEIIENIIRVTWGEGFNYSLDWKVKAEAFLKEVSK